MPEKYKNVQFADNIYWVGSNDQVNGLHCNSYLIIDNDEGILIEPGSVLDFDIIFKNVSDLINIDKIKYIILGHQDPDLCSSTPLFEKSGFKGKVVCHWRASVIIKYYGITSDFYCVDEHNYKLVLNSGREFLFIPTPYLHFPGAIATFDIKSKTLFSSDLFGSFSFNWTLYPGDDYLESMKVFHEHYMPGNSNLRPVMEQLLKMDINTIAPQHGCILKENIKKYIITLRDLECGSYLTPIKKELSKTGGYSELCNQILRRYYSIFNKSEVMSIFKNTHIVLNEESGTIEDFNMTGEELWNDFFEIIFANKGISWLNVVEILVSKIKNDYEIEMPDTYKSKLYNVEAEIEKLNEENKKLKELNEHLKSSLEQTQESLIKCPITNLYNEDFFLKYMQSEISNYMNEKKDFCLFLIDLDNISSINIKYGSSEGDETIKNISYLINSIREETHLLFKMKGPQFAFFIPECEKSQTLEIAEKIRNAVEKSEIFIEKMTVSIGLGFFTEISESESFSDKILDKIIRIIKNRVRLAKNLGMNYVCSSSETESFDDSVGKIVIIDTDSLNLDILKTSLEQQKYKIFTCNDGIEGLNLIEKENPDLVLCELMIPKMDGFSLRDKLLSSSSLKNIPFLLMSYRKDEETVDRAMFLRINHFFQKPYMLSEVTGHIKNLIKGEHSK